MNKQKLQGLLDNEYFTPKTREDLEDILEALIEYNHEDNIKDITLIKMIEMSENAEVQKELKSKLFPQVESKQRYQYQLLGRLVGDCKYYLGNGNRNKKDLWALDVNKQIDKMIELYNILEIKPEWLTMVDITNYKKSMLDD